MDLESCMEALRDDNRVFLNHKDFLLNILALFGLKESLISSLCT